jgi:hypothetical protein
MQSIEAELQNIRELIQRANPAQAEARFYQLLDSLSLPELARAASALEMLVQEFLPKRARQLAAQLDRRLGLGKDADPIPALRERVRMALSDLSEHNIFSWSTYYRDVVGDVFGQAYLLLRSYPRDNVIPSMLSEEFARHATEIYAKGYTHLTTRRSILAQLDPLEKSLSGLQRFLEVPVEFYSSQLPNATQVPTAKPLRAICSAMLTGILLGYSQTSFGAEKGSRILAQAPRSWAHFLPFMHQDDADRFSHSLDHGTFRDGVRETVLPTACMIDTLLETPPIDAFPLLPALGQYSSQFHRVEIALLLPPSAQNRRYVDIHCYLNEAFVQTHVLQESADQGVALIPK